MLAPRDPFQNIPPELPVAGPADETGRQPVRPDIGGPRDASSAPISARHEQGMSTFLLRQSGEHLNVGSVLEVNFIRAEQYRPISPESCENRVVLGSDNLRLEALRHLNPVVIGKARDR